MGAATYGRVSLRLASHGKDSRNAIGKDLPQESITEQSTLQYPRYRGIICHVSQRLTDIQSLS